LTVLGALRLTIASGAGGSNCVESYVGIGRVFDNFHFEIFRLLRMN
jgi:hypothetical protein